MKVLVIAGSARHGSLNTRLAEVVAAVRPQDSVRLVNRLDRLPYYDGDVEAAGDPAAVRELRRGVAEADVVVMVTPEYNGTVPGMLGNALDWLSRPHGGSVLRAKPVVVLSASPGRSGGARAAEHLRAVLSRIGARVVPVGLSVSRAHRRLEDGKADPELAVELAEILEAGLDRGEAHQADTPVVAA